MDIEGIAIGGIGVEEAAAGEALDPLVPRPWPPGRCGGFLDPPDGGGGSGAPRGSDETRGNITRPGVFLGSYAVPSTSTGWGLNDPESRLDAATARL